MRIRISDKSLHDGELTLKVSNFLATSCSQRYGKISLSQSRYFRMKCNDGLSI